MYKALLLLLLCAFATTSKAQTSLNHIALYVTDLNKSFDFYHQFLSLDTIPEPFHDGKHIWFKIGEHSQLHLISGATTKTTQDKNSHLCFRVPTLDPLIGQLNKAGIAYEDWPGKKSAVTLRVDGVRQIYFQDPDGYWLEVNDDRY